MPRFGVSIIPSATGRSDPVVQARRAEELGFDLVSIWDHPHGANPSFETWTLMTWIAARTTRIHLASDVLGLPFRLPALTAKMAETLDRLSDGRLILGLGGGGDDEEFAGLGAPVRTASEKVVVRRAAEHAGRDPDSLDYAYNVSVRIGGPPADDPERRVTGEPR